MVRTYKRGLTEATGWLVLLSLLMVFALVAPKTVSDVDSKDFILLTGATGIWRYSTGGMHLLHGMLFLHVVCPYHRQRVRQSGSVANPSHVLLMVTSFRIDTLATVMVYRSVIREAIDSGYPTVVVCSITETSDEVLVRSLWEKMNPPNRISPGFVRIPDTGRCNGLAYGFRTISQHLPDDNVAVAVIDGDTVFDHGVIKKTVPWFKFLPNVGGLTTNGFCEVQGGYMMSEWHKLRFTRRHINMCPMVLSRCVLTITGRMLVFCARMVTNPEFITDVEDDYLEHWRLGRFKLLTGDDKSSWFSLTRLGCDIFYVPNAAISTVEYPPEESLIKASRKLMYCWYGNNLRQNPRALKLDTRRLGWFTMPAPSDQRVPMWTSLFGLVVAILTSPKCSITFLLVYLFWIGLTRLVPALPPSLSGYRIGPAYPLTLYYNRIAGALVKIYVFFRPDRQPWTHQPTKLERSLASS